MSSEMRQKVSVTQIKAARQLLEWTQQRLADEAGIGVVSVKRHEGGGKLKVVEGTIEKMVAALEREVEFLPQDENRGMGVRKKSPD